MYKNFGHFTAGLKLNYLGALWPVLRSSGKNLHKDLRNISALAGATVKPSILVTTLAFFVAQVLPDLPPIEANLKTNVRKTTLESSGKALEAL